MSDSDSLKILEIVAPYVRWPNPAVMNSIAVYNESDPVWTSQWRNGLVVADINPDLYMWPGSTCLYPGIRRRIGNESLHSYAAVECLKTDRNGNQHGKWGWSKLLAAFDTLRNGYHLVHLFPHKPDELEKFLGHLATVHGGASAWNTLPLYVQQYGLPGLFSSWANVCYIPGDLTRPTDADSSLKRALIQQALLRYGVRILPPFLAEVASQILAETFQSSAPLGWDDTPYGDPTRVAGLQRHQREEFAKHLKDWRDNQPILIPTAT